MGAAVPINAGDDARATAALETEFHRVCDVAVKACRTLSPPYHPKTWIGMVDKWGAVEAARRLVISGDIQAGFGRLVEAGRPELTVEWAICDPKWTSLFSERYREAARWRLRQAHVVPPG